MTLKAHLVPRPNVAITYFKHLFMYEDSWFRYFALSTAMRWHALQAVWIYVCQHPHDVQLSVEKLCDMIGREVNPLELCASLCCLPA